MTTPSILPAGFDGTTSDFAKTKGVDRSGAVRLISDSVEVASGTAVDAVIGLIPFNKGQRINLNDRSFYVGNIGAASTTLNFGYVYNDDTTYTNDTDAFVSLSTAAQAGGFVTIDEKGSLLFEAEADGWIVAEVKGAATDATGDIEFNVLQAYAG